MNRLEGCESAAKALKQLLPMWNGRPEVIGSVDLRAARIGNHKWIGKLGGDPVDVTGVAVFLELTEENLDCFTQTLHVRHSSEAAC
jgi:hypothetical protein